MLRIVYNNQTFTVADIDNLPNLYRAMDPISYSLEYDVFNFKIKSEATGEHKIKEMFDIWLATQNDEGLIVDYGDFSDFVYGAPVKIYEDNKLKATMYVTDITPANQRDVGDELYQMQCVSAIGILSRMEHYGGIYTGNTVGSIIASIMGDLSYSINSALSAVQLYGWLPYVKDARKNLNKVLFASGAIVTRTTGGNVYFTYPSQATAKAIPRGRTFYGGIVAKKEHKSEITVVEHGYYQSLEAQEELIFDNTQGVAGSNTRITFDEPYYAYRGDGLTVVSSSANYAVITGVGYLYAKKYVHTQRPVTQTIDTIGEPEIMNVSDQTLVSSLNVNGIVNRLVNYYSTAKIRTFDIEVKDERPGDLVEFYDRRDNANTGYIKSIDETASSFWRGTVNAVTDWTPTKGGNDFTKYTIVTDADLSEGVWTVPSNMRGKRARVVLFSGAEGGQGGYAGETMGRVSGSSANKRVYSSSSGSRETTVGGLQDGVQRGGKGGKGGAGGASATRMINIDVDSLKSSYMVSFGAGGKGGAGGTVTRDSKFNVKVTNPQMGGQGFDSVFNGVPTSMGSVFRGTYVNLITGKSVTGVGENGKSGADGGRGGYSEQIRGPFNEQADANAYNYSSQGKGINGGGIGSYRGGAGSNGILGSVVRAGYGWNLQEGKYYIFGNAGGGGGGGAAMGSNGGAGSSGHSSVANFTLNDGGEIRRVTLYYVNRIREDEDENEELVGGRGGDGANATLIPSKPLYVGGTGGHGGGGGGGAGQCLGNQFTTSGGNDNYHGSMYGGKGGNGGKGGDGSNGFMIVYY